MLATTLLKLLLLSTLDSVAQDWPSVRLAVVVDDVQLTCVCDSAFTTTRLVRGAVAACVKGFEKDAELVVSVPKFQVLTGSSDAATVVARFGGVLANGLVTNARSLGVDFSGGKPRQASAVRKGRLTKARARLPFMRRLRAAGACTARLARTALAPAMLYGVGITGLGPALLLAARRIMRGGFSHQDAWEEPNP